MYKAGTIVLIPFPFTDLSGSKVRPALIVSNPPQGDDIVVVFLSSKGASGANKYDLKVDASKENGLKASSIIRCAKIATLDKKMILGELGALESKYIKLVGKNLRQILI